MSLISSNQNKIFIIVIKYCLNYWRRNVKTTEGRCVNPATVGKPLAFGGMLHCGECYTMGRSTLWRDATSLGDLLCGGMVHCGGILHCWGMLHCWVMLQCWGMQHCGGMLHCRGMLHCGGRCYNYCRKICYNFLVHLLGVCFRGISCCTKGCLYSVMCLH